MTSRQMVKMKPIFLFDPLEYRPHTELRNLIDPEQMSFPL